jgi:uncharacterized protein YkwD
MRILTIIGILIGTFSTVSSQAQVFTGDNFESATLEKQTIKLINSYRSKNGVKPLEFNSFAQKAAADQAKYIRSVKKLDHQQPNKNKQDVWDRLKFHSGKLYSSGENLAMVYILQRAYVWDENGNQVIKTINTYEEAALAIFHAWKASSRHNKNMLNPNYEFSGLSIQFNPEDKSIWICHVFGSEPK